MLTRETFLKSVGGYRVGDMKAVPYSIAFTLNQLVEPANDMGWFLVNGAVISQTDFPLLYARYGATFNVGGEGVGNFRLPDLTDGRLPIPKGLASFPTFGASGGASGVTLAFAEMPSHNHPNSLNITASSHGHTTSGGTTGGESPDGHGHGYQTPTTGGSGGGEQGDNVYGVSGQTTGGSSSSSHSHSVSVSLSNATTGLTKTGTGIGATGGGGSHNNVQPYLVLGGWLVRHD